MTTFLLLVLVFDIFLVSYRLGANAANRVWIVAAAAQKGVDIEGQLFMVKAIDSGDID